MELRETFRAPFLQMAWQRYSRIAELVAQGGVAELRSAASEFHCLSGEASMLDFADVADIARYGEQSARQGDHPRVVQLVSDLERAIKAVEGGAGASEAKETL